MRTDIENHKSGWSGRSLGLRLSDIEPLSAALRNLAENGNEAHFHRMNYAEDEDHPPGVIDLEVYLQRPVDRDNMFPTYGGPKPKRD